MLALRSASESACGKHWRMLQLGGFWARILLRTGSLVLPDFHCNCDRLLAVEATQFGLLGTAVEETVKG